MRLWRSNLDLEPTLKPTRKLVLKLARKLVLNLAIGTLRLRWI